MHTEDLIDKKTLSVRIYDALKADIVRGDVAPGETFTNAELQKRFGVSSIPIRDALIRLQQDGLVDEPSRSGARVRELTFEEALAVNELASLICASAVGLAFERNQDAALPEAVSALKKQREHMEAESYFDYDYDFHMAFLNNCGNAHYKRVYRLYSILLEMLARRAIGAGPESIYAIRLECMGEHSRIVEAFASDRAEAERAMEAHYSSAAERIRKYMGGGAKKPKGQPARG